MFSKEYFEQRIAAIANELERVVVGHHSLSGQLAEAKWMLEQFLAAELAKKAAEDKAAAEAVPDGAIPA